MCNYLFIHPSSKSGHTLRYQVLALQHVNLGGEGDTIQPIKSQNWKEKSVLGRYGEAQLKQGQTLGDARGEGKHVALKAESSR